MRRITSPHALVALPIGFRRVLTYAVPPDLSPAPRIGHRVRVPLGNRQVHGYVAGFSSDPPPQGLRSILAVDPPEVLFTPEILRLAEWAADYYLVSLGQMLEAALPASIRRGVRARRSAQPAAPVDPVLAAALAAPVPPFNLEPEQRAAARSILSALEAEPFAAFLLHGVTGSGKTEVYFEAAEEVVRSGGGVLFLVPEIALGTQILARVRRRFPDRAGLYHSQTGEAERRRIWERARDGALPVIVGTRSAVWVPMPRLRLIVIDEEQESAYKQEETPRYHGRDVAVMRARLAGAVAVLGSATPSLESLHNVTGGKYTLLRLSSRIDNRPPARVVVVDLSEGRGASELPGRPGPRRASGPRPILSPVLLRALQERLDRGEQSILFLNRRGHSTVVQCADCGQPVQCGQCDVAMTFHKTAGILRCHYCGAVRRGLDSCSGCRGLRFLYVGVGTQKVEEMLREFFPGARIARMDFDATRRRGAHLEMIQAMERGEIDILLGTQMVAKGFHFPAVTLVGVIQADREMLQPDFRAPERAFRILTQVAGRAGRERPGEVVFQSLLPDHHVIACAAGEDYAGFAEREMRHRHDYGFPPYTRMIDLLVDGAKEDQVERRARDLAEGLRKQCETAGLDRGRKAVEILGPAPMPLSRLKGRYRWHLTLKGASAPALHDIARHVLELPAPEGLSRTRIQIDVDPLSLG